jgi:CheY-like chemotaxis protein
MSFHRLSVLLVDDCAYMRMIISAVLRGIGFTRIIEAADGAQALEELRLQPIDMLICDYAMPVIDGLELTQLLRSAPDSPAPRIPIIMMTAHTERSRIQAARDAGVSELISKPLSSKTLIDRLIAVIDSPRPWVMGRAYTGPCRRRKSGGRYDGPLRRAEDQELDLDTEWKRA